VLDVRVTADGQLIRNGSTGGGGVGALALFAQALANTHANTSAHRSERNSVRRIK